MINLDATDKNIAKLNENLGRERFEVRIPTGPQLMTLVMTVNIYVCL